jgi:hypothetical protein
MISLRFRLLAKLTNRRGGSPIPFTLTQERRSSAVEVLQKLDQVIREPQTSFDGGRSAASTRNKRRNAVPLPTQPLEVRSREVPTVGDIDAKNNRKTDAGGDVKKNAVAYTALRPTIAAKTRLTTQKMMRANAAIRANQPRDFNIENARYHSRQATKNPTIAK